MPRYLVKILYNF